MGPTHEPSAKALVLIVSDVLNAVLLCTGWSTFYVNIAVAPVQEEHLHSGNDLIWSVLEEAPPNRSDSPPFCSPSDPRASEGPGPVQLPPSTARGQPLGVLPPDGQRQPEKSLWRPADPERRSGSSAGLHRPCGR